MTLLEQQTLDALDHTVVQNVIIRTRNVMNLSIVSSHNNSGFDDHDNGKFREYGNVLLKWIGCEVCGIPKEYINCSYLLADIRVSEDNLIEVYPETIRKMDL